MVTPESTKTMVNFGGNIRLRPENFYEPSTEEELIEILQRHRGARVCVVGRLHSWSRVIDAKSVIIDLRRMNRVIVHAEPSQPIATVEAGCQIKDLVSELGRQGRYTTPTLGLIKEQAFVGAAATGTHGSGRNCLSHYIQSVRLVRYDAKGNVEVKVVSAGRELAAARCSLGLLGIITQVTIPIRSQYMIEEHFRSYSTLAEVLNKESEYPLQQFFLVPWIWKYYAQHRKEIMSSRSWLAPLYRLYWSIGMDISFHLIVRALARMMPAWCTIFYYRHIMTWLVPLGWKVVDRSDRQLTMNHALFRHIEIEMFVVRSLLFDAIEFVKILLRHAAGESVEIPGMIYERIKEHGLEPMWTELKGQYQHHYPICIRKILSDETMLAMSSGAEDVYSLSFISYAKVNQRVEFELFASFLAKSLALLYQARPHWGKYCPLSQDELHQLYPRWEEFKEIIQADRETNHWGSEWAYSLFNNR